MLNRSGTRRVLVFAGLAGGLLAATRIAAAESRRDARLIELLGRPVGRPQPVGAYVPARRSGNLLYLSTTVARDRGGVPLFKGAVGGELTLDQGRAAARAAALSILETLHAELGGSLEPLVQIVNMIGYVVSADGFFDQAKVMDGASGLMVDVLGPEAGASSRSAIGIKGLTGNGAVAISAVAEVRG